MATFFFLLIPLTIFIVLCFALAQGEINRISSMTPEEQEANQQKNRRRSSSYDHWYQESYNHIHGVFKHRKRDAYARRQADKELRKYIKSIK